MTWKTHDNERRLSETAALRLFSFSAASLSYPAAFKIIPLFVRTTAGEALADKYPVALYRREKVASVEAAEHYAQPIRPVPKLPALLGTVYVVQLRLRMPRQPLVELGL